MNTLPTHLTEKHVTEAKALLSLELSLRKQLAELERKKPFYQKEFKYLEKLIYVDSTGTQTFIPDLSDEHLINITRYHAERNRSISSVPAKYLDEVRNRGLIDSVFSNVPLLKNAFDDLDLSPAEGNF